MNIDLANLRINRIIVHQIYKRGDDKELIPPKISRAFTKLDVSGQATLQDRIVGAIGKDLSSIEMFLNEVGPDSVYEICNEIIEADDNSFMDGSSKLAEKLAVSQLYRNIPGGTLVVFTGLVGSDNKDYVGIIKAELHSGFNLQEKSNSLLLQFLAELLLTPQQKLYKIALLINNSKTDQAKLRSPGDFTVLVYDHLIKNNNAGEAAQYFYESFLGCGFSPTAKMLTSDFYRFTKEFIDTLDIEGEDKVDMNTYLYTYLKGDQNKVIRVAEYAKNYLPIELRDPYQQFMTKKDFPTNAVPKDLAYLKSKLRRRQLKFTSDVKINAPMDNFGELVKIREREEGRTIIAIEGHVESES